MPNNQTVPLPEGIYTNEYLGKPNNNLGKPKMWVIAGYC